MATRAYFSSIRVISSAGISADFLFFISHLQTPGCSFMERGSGRAKIGVFIQVHRFGAAKRNIEGN
jgi:hypothetical protein